MFQRSVIAHRVVRLATLAAIACATWIQIHGARLGPAIFAARPSFSATTWAATLPAALAAPTLPASLQLVSMVADDIDADGDLDVVANDGSLDLIVWINDGTGQLTRRRVDGAQARPHLLDGLRVTPDPAGSQVLAHASSPAPLLDAAAESGPTNTCQPHRLVSAESAATPLATARAPRGPPLSASAA